jgi:hypothetical protein
LDILLSQEISSLPQLKKGASWHQHQSDCKHSKKEVKFQDYKQNMFRNNGCCDLPIITDRELQEATESACSSDSYCETPFHLNSNAAMKQYQMTKGIVFPF